MMEPLTLIVTALVAGATAAAKETTGQAIKDAYNGLKALIKRRFQGKPEAEIALEKHEEKPQVWEKPLQEALTEVGATEDEEILKAAQEVQKHVDPKGAAKGKYNVQFHGKVIAAYTGDHGTLNLTYTEKED